MTNVVGVIYLYENQNTCQQLSVAFLLEYTCIFWQLTVVLLHQGFFNHRSVQQTGFVCLSLSFITICYAKDIRYIFIFQIIEFPNVLKLPILISFSGLDGRCRTSSLHGCSVWWAKSFIWICSKYIIGFSFQIPAQHFFFGIMEEKFTIVRYRRPNWKVWEISVVITKLWRGIQKFMYDFDDNLAFEI